MCVCVTCACAMTFNNARFQAEINDMIIGCILYIISKLNTKRVGEFDDYKGDNIEYRRYGTHDRQREGEIVSSIFLY